jgi:hypothetical protein
MLYPKRGSCQLDTAPEHGTAGLPALRVHSAGVLTPLSDENRLALAADLLDSCGHTAQELRVAAAACNGAAGIRRAIGNVGMGEGDALQQAEILESVAGKLAQLAQTLDVNR